jgi:hypothetical protein
MRFALHPFHCIAQFIPEVRDRETAHIAQFDPFDLLPEGFIRVEAGSGSRWIRRAALLARNSLMVWLRWVGALSQMSIIRPGTSPSKCSRNATTSAELMGRS